MGWVASRCIRGGIPGPAASGLMDRPSDDVQRPTFLRWYVSPGRRFWRRAGHKVTLDLVRHIRPSPGGSRANFFFPRVPLVGRVVKVILPGVKATRARRKNNMTLLPSHLEAIALPLVGI